PDVSVNGGVAQTQQKIKGRDKVNLANYSLGLLVNYEVDLWGKISATQKSSKLQLKASREDVSTAIMSISAQIAETWVNLISLKNQEKALRRQLDINQKLLELIKFRFENARASAIDIYQQQQAISAINSGLIPLTAQQQLLKHQLALLLGKNPVNNTLILDENTFPQISETPEPGLPLDLIAMRPDVRAAGLRLKAANWEITVARADRLPSLRLTASNTFSSDEFATLFDNWLINLAANAVGPVFDGNRRKNEIKRVEAVVDERIASYRKIVITAIKEVEDALVKEKYNRLSLRAIQQQLKISEKTFNEAGSRYLNGVSDYLPVLREQLNITAFENSIIKAKADIIIARIQLKKAIGGSWADKIQAKATEK
ncbi:MAG: efflux transporter outer membrane subunit, partial [Thiotrichaceae bacterium]|nr:efflux transporter outer membrane subunit [Thiotrichaceae bacterium]